MIRFYHLTVLLALRLVNLYGAQCFRCGFAQCSDSVENFDRPPRKWKRISCFVTHKWYSKALEGGWHQRRLIAVWRYSPLGNVGLRSFLSSPGTAKKCFLCGNHHNLAYHQYFIQPYRLHSVIRDFMSHGIPKKDICQSS